MAKREQVNQENPIQEIGETLETEIISAKREFRIRWTEVAVSLGGLLGGVILLCLGYSSILALSMILFGALWNFFTESNKFFACIMAFCMCFVYGVLAGAIELYGHAFLHILFYLPTQLIYYYESQKNENNEISHDKCLTRTGFIGTVVAGWLVAFGLGIVLYKLGDSFYILDSVSTALLIVSVFMSNGKYREYYPTRVFACFFATIMWIVIGIYNKFANNEAIFALLFLMYVVMDSIKWVRWLKKK